MRVIKVWKIEFKIKGSKMEKRKKKCLEPRNLFINGKLLF